MLNASGRATVAAAAAFLTACPVSQFVAPARLQKARTSLVDRPWEGLFSVGQNECTEKANVPIAPPSGASAAPAGGRGRGRGAQRRLPEARRGGWRIAPGARKIAAEKCIAE